MRVFELRQSRRASATILGASTIAVAALVMSSVAWPVAVPGALLVLAVGWREARPRCRRVAALSVRDDGRWSAHYADGRRITGSLQADSFVHPWLCVLVIRDGWRRVPVTVPADAMTPDAHRRLRVLLRWLPRPCARPAASWSRQSPWPG